MWKTHHPCLRHAFFWQDNDMTTNEEDLTNRDSVNPVDSVLGSSKI